ncbi:ATP-NAD kinase, partial [Helicosporidium sp. ATCC 50920]
QGALHSGGSASSTEAGAAQSAGDKPHHAPSSPGWEPGARDGRGAYDDDGECCGVVLNELVIDRGQATSLTCLEVYADRHFVTVIAGDGLIVATPTGSTAYNLAAGGSMIHPGVPAMLFTPICPHTLASRPLVFPDNVTLSIRVSLDSRAGAYCGFDGKNRMHLRPGDGLVIKLSQWPVPTVCNLDASHDWFLAARDGLNWNVRHAQDPLHSPPRLER